MPAPEKTFLDAHPDAVIVVDTTGAILLVNESAEELFGYRRSELIGRTVDLLVPEHSRDEHAGNRGRFHSEPIARPMGSAETQRGQRRDGTEFAAGVSLSPISTEQGTFVAATIRDMTDAGAAEAYALSRREAIEENVLHRSKTQT